MKKGKLFSTALGLALVLAEPFAHAAYNANMSGTVTSVVTYTEADYILFRLDNQPSSHPTCNPNYCIIAAVVSADRRKAILSRLLLAKASGEVINIGHDNASECSSGYIQVSRVG